MAFYLKTLQDMKVAIEKKDWDTVNKILQLHNKNLGREVEHDISEISLAISNYNEDLIQISGCLRAKLEKGTNTEDIMKLKVDDAIECAKRFEKTLKHLIDEGKFL